MKHTYRFNVCRICMIQCYVSYMCACVYNIYTYDMYDTYTHMFNVCRIHTHTQCSICMYVCVYIYIYICFQTSTYVCVYVYVCVCVCKCVCVCMCVHIQHKNGVEQVV